MRLIVPLEVMLDDDMCVSASIESQNVRDMADLAAPALLAASRHFWRLRDARNDGALLGRVEEGRVADTELPPPAVELFNVVDPDTDE